VRPNFLGKCVRPHADTTEGLEETAVERERYTRDGYPLSAANVRTSRLHRMRVEARENAPLVHSTLGPNELWGQGPRYCHLGPDG
jgi:hypothetical protein